MQKEQAIQLLQNSVDKCIKIQPKFQPKTSQHTLLSNRILALQIVLCLLRKQDASGYTLEELEKAVAPIESIIHKTSKARSKYEEESKQYRRFTPLIEATQLAKEALLVELEKRGNRDADTNRICDIEKPETC